MNNLNYDFKWIGNTFDVVHENYETLQGNLGDLKDKLDQDIRNLENEFESLNGLANTFRNLSTKAHYRPKKATSQQMFENAPEALNFVIEQCREDIEKYNFDIPKSN